jgi:hypothetical protein
MRFQIWFFRRFSDMGTQSTLSSSYNDTGWCCVPLTEEEGTHTFVIHSFWRTQRKELILCNPHDLFFAKRTVSCVVKKKEKEQQRGLLIHVDEVYK